MSKSICAHLYFAIKLTLGMPLMKVLKNRLKLFTSYWQSTGKNYRNNSNPPHSGHENRRLQLSKMAEPTDAGGHIRALAAEDKTYGETAANNNGAKRGRGFHDSRNRQST